MVFELCSCDLEDFVKGKVEKFLRYSAYRGLCVLLDAAYGMSYIHGVGIIHRDLKPQNILLTNSGHGKVNDYGVARKAAVDVTMTSTGTPIYMSPEISLGKRYDSLTDVFSFGIMLYEIMARKKPYEDEHDAQGGKASIGTLIRVAQNGLRPKLDGTWNGSVSMLMAMCWQEDPQARPNFHEISEILKKALDLATGPGPSLVGGSGGDERSNKMQRRNRSDAENLSAIPLWRSAQVDPKSIIKGKLIGEGASADVFLATFRAKPAALKVFRGVQVGQESKCFNEIALTFELRHPNIIGMLAWFHIIRDPPRIGMVLEYGERGALDRFYKSEVYTFHDGVRVALGAAKGMTHMHSFPIPIIHRDLKSPNILIVGGSELMGKIGDCGESRRIDNTSTMTHVGSFHWCAPEMLSGARYDEYVDVYSFGIVLYEIRMQKLPYRRHWTQGAKGMDMRLVNAIREGQISAASELDEIKDVIHPRFLALIRKCTSRNQRERPPMWACVAELEEILEDVSQMADFAVGARVKVTDLAHEGHPLPAKDSSFQEWMPLRVTSSLQTYPERLDDREEGEKLRQLVTKVNPFVKRAGWVAERVFNAAHLHRFLIGARGSVASAGMDVVRCISKRKEVGADVRRLEIISNDYSASTLPHAGLAQTAFPHNLELYLHQGRQMSYVRLGKLEETVRIQIEQWQEYVLLSLELRLMMIDTVAALYCRETPQISIWNFQHANLSRRSLSDGNMHFELTY